MVDAILEALNMNHMAIIKIKKKKTFILYRHLMEINV
jgi:hypothetical protein